MSCIFYILNVLTSFRQLFMYLHVTTLPWPSRAFQIKSSNGKHFQICSPKWSRMWLYGYKRVYDAILEFPSINVLAFIWCENHFTLFFSTLRSKISHIKRHPHFRRIVKLYMYSNNRTTTNERIFNFNADLKLLTNPTNSDSIYEDNRVFFLSFLFTMKSIIIIKSQLKKDK